MGRSYVQQGVPIGLPRYSFTPKAGDEFYLSGKKVTVKRVGTSDGTDYVWFVRPVDGTLAMSVSNLYQGARVPENSPHAPYEYRQRSKANPSGAPLDTHAARELELFITSDAQLYRSQEQPIQKNLITKMARGVYNHDLAVKLYGYLMENGAKKYIKEHGSNEAGEWSRVFSPATRKHAAEEFAKSFEVEAKLGNYDNFLPKKYQKKQNPAMPPALHLLKRDVWTPAMIAVKKGAKKVRGMIRVTHNGLVQAKLPQKIARAMNPAGPTWDVLYTDNGVTRIYTHTRLSYAQAQADAREAKKRGYQRVRIIKLNTDYPTRKSNPDLAQSAFDAGRQWYRVGQHSSGVANARVVRYGYLKWWGSQSPATTKGHSKGGKLERAFREGWSSAKRSKNPTGKRYTVALTSEAGSLIHAFAADTEAEVKKIVSRIKRQSLHLGRIIRVHDTKTLTNKVVNPSGKKFEVQYFDGNNWKFLVTTEAKTKAEAMKEARRMFKGRYLPLSKLRAQTR